MKITFLYSNGALFTARGVLDDSLTLAMNKSGKRFVQYSTVKPSQVTSKEDNPDSGIYSLSSLGGMVLSEYTIDVEKSGLVYLIITNREISGSVEIIATTKAGALNSDIAVDLLNSIM